MSDGDRGAAPLSLVLEGGEDCPVCGLGNAFAAVQHYDVCARCGWVDDPAAYLEPDRKSDTNDCSLNEARRIWPAVLVRQLANAPGVTFGVALRDDEIGGYDYIIDGAILRDMFDASPWNLKASIGPWPTARDWRAPLRTASPQTPTGRCRLYVCPLCGGDDYEAALTADVHATQERVIWSRIGLEIYEYTPEGWEVNLRGGPSGFAFDAREYRRALSM